MIRLGAGGVPIQTDDPWEIARADKSFGYSATYCEQAELRDTASVKDIREAFRKKNVLLAEVGAAWQL